MTVSAFPSPKNPDHCVLINERLAGRITDLSVAGPKCLIDFREETKDRWTMQIKFRNEKTGKISDPYQYCNVSKDLIIKFLFADSLLSVYQKEVRGNKSLFIDRDCEGIT